ncbi:phage minor head protein [Sinimarinibacterium sp. NLF-5-8]|uniref:phage head morphogenesis protein n=1 Tax=Sinimarinibacterium sp. NLF-5-8 TaxID=2698684 RepID=UPI00137BAA21|nr:phage minor head protein [Sinimarinibacterium sp. NLF-5-8]QHS09594.1 hypothetical protein GT972_05065 [Sinimarinibacterium sp. NLF-5-8]
MTEREFIKQLTPELQRMGWWGKKVFVDSAGKAEVVQEGSPWRLKTIYRTNVMSAYNAARYKQQYENADSRPYWMYIAVMDAKTRPQHAVLHGRVFRFDDPIWDTIYPSNSFNCRCRVRALTEAQIKARGLTVESSKGRLKQVMQEVAIDKRTGEIIQRPAWQYTAPDGRTMTPSPGWNYNPGRAAFQPDLERYDYDLARQYVEGMLTGPAFARAWNKWEVRVAQIRAETPGIADDAIREMLKHEAVPASFWPVAILSAADRQLLGTQTQVARLSDWTLAKQAVSRSKQGFKVDTYWRVQPTIETAITVLKNYKPTGTEVYLFYGEGNGVYVAVLKPTKNQATGADELYLDSFRKSSNYELARLRTKLEVLR